MNLKRLIFEQTLTVFFFMNCVLIISELLNYILGGTAPTLPWYIPISLMVIAFLTSLPTVIFYIRPEDRHITMKLKVALHYLLLFCIVLGSGYFFKWYSDLTGFIITAVAFTVIYILVWIFTALVFKQDEKKINAALDKIRDEE